MYYYTAYVWTSKGLNASLQGKMKYDLKRRVYVGRTLDPHRRSRAWSKERSHGLGRCLIYLKSRGYIENVHFAAVCNVWFCITGSKNTPQWVWNAPETAFKLLVARRQKSLHDQKIELSDRRGRLTSGVLSYLVETGATSASELTLSAHKVLERAFDSTS